MLRKPKNMVKAPSVSRTGVGRQRHQGVRADAGAEHSEGQQYLDLLPVRLLAVGAAEHQRGGEVEREHERNRELQRLRQREQRHGDQRGAEARDAAYEIRAHQNAQHQNHVSHYRIP